ncbi:hypothetical protein SH661x_002457 [Planctomicrobium sp. SH661]
MKSSQGSLDRSVLSKVDQKISRRADASPGVIAKGLALVGSRKRFRLVAI